MAALTFYGVSREEAIGLSLITHAVQLLVVVAVGAICLVAEDLRVGELIALAWGRRKGDQ